MKKTKRKALFATAIVLLMLLSFFTGVLVTRLFLKTNENLPATVIDIKPDKNSSSAVASSEEVPPKVDIADKLGSWKKQINIEIFKAEYNGETDEVDVKSADGKKVIAPGTENTYEFRINNHDANPVRYTLEAFSKAVLDKNGKVKELPLKTRLSSMDGKYLAGSENSFVNVTKLNGVTHTDGISPEHYTKYTLDWQWPFEGDDDIDTLLGNLSADGEEITVEIAFKVTAESDPDAVGGNPLTGDNSKIGLWMALFVCSAFMIVILLFTISESKKDRKNENETRAQN